MHKAQLQVTDFHLACQQGAPKSIHFHHSLVDWDSLKGLRTTQIQEEFDEFKEAVENKDVLGTIHELCDLLYVVYGAIVVLGIDIEPFFDEIQQANMTKCGGPRREDGKQLKPEGWHPANLLRVFRTIYNDNYDRIPTSDPIERLHQ